MLRTTEQQVNNISHKDIVISLIDRAGEFTMKRVC